MSNTLHYCPADGYFGDPIPFYWNGTYHVFYDKLQSNGLVCWAHVSSTDLVHWEEHPDAVQTGADGEPDCNGCITGSVIEHNGTFYAIYTGVNQGYTTICLARSSDLIHWEKDPNNPFIVPDTDWYAGCEAWRDPCVFWNDEAGCYWMVFCARTPRESSHPFTGCMGLATSTDLINWALQRPVWITGHTTVVECPDVFKIGSKWMLMYFWHESRLRIADSPSGPWIRPKVQAPDGFDFFAGKTMGDANHRISIAWIPRRDCDCAPRTWGGEMLIPRELYLLADGTPATRMPDTVRSFLTSKKCDRQFSVCSGNWQIENNCMAALPEQDGSALVCIADAPDNYYLSFDVELDELANLNIFIRGEEDPASFWPNKTPLDKGYLLNVDPVDGCISLYKSYMWNQRNAIAVMPYKEMQHKVSIELVVDGDILEVFIDKQRSMVSRLLDSKNGSLGLLVQDGSVKLRNVILSEL